MPTSAASGSSRLGRIDLGGGRTTGIEASDSSIRIAQLTRSGRRCSWRLELAPLSETVDAGSEPLDGRALRRALRTLGIGRSRAVCILGTASLDVFPLGFDPKQVRDLDASVVEHAQDRLSYPVGEAVLDYVEIPSWARRPGDWSTNVLVYAVPRTHVGDLLDRLGAAGLRVERVLTPASALAPRLAVRDAEEDQRQLLIAIGEEVISISVVQGGHVLLERVLPWGAERLMAAAAASLGLTPSQARALVAGTHPAGDAESTGPATKDMERVVGDILSGELDELARETLGCVGYCTSFLKSAEITRVAMVGPFAGSPSVTAFLQRAMDVRVVTLDGPAENVSGSGTAGDPAFAAAASCALFAGEPAA